MYIRSLSTLVLGALIFAACLPVEATASTSMRVGVLIPLSGKDAKIGQYFKKGITLAAKENPDRYSSIKWHFQDSHSDKRAAISGLRHLIDKQRVHVVIGLASSMPAKAQRYVKSRSVPIILVSNLLERAQSGDLIFNLGAPVESVEKLISSWLFTRRCKQAKGLLVSHPIVDTFAQNLSKRKSFSIAAKFRPSEFDFRSGLIKASHKKTDCVVAAIPVASVDRFLGQLGAQSAGKYVLLLQVGGDRIQRKPMAEVRKRELVTISQRISKEFSKRLGKMPHSSQLAVAQGYEVVRLLLEQEFQSPEQVADSLRTVSNRKSSLGKLSFIEMETKQFFETKPGFRTIWNRQRRRNRR